MTKISTIIISYNEKEYFLRAFESVLAQAKEGIEIEIIIGDDGSNDGSIELIKQLEKDDRILNSQGAITLQYFIQERPPASEKIIPSLRVSANINKGLEMATGDYCVILSADDKFCDDTKYQTAINFLNDHRDYASYLSGYRATGMESYEKVPTVISSFFFWAHMDYFHISCYVFRRFDPSLLPARFSDDTGIQYSILRLGKCKGDKSITFEYEQRVASIMHSSTPCKLSIIEGMLYQDILNCRSINAKWRLGTRARLYKKIRDLYSYRNQIHKDEFKHFLENSKKYPNNILDHLTTKRGRMVFRMILLRMAFDHYLVGGIWRICKIVERKK